LQKPPPGIAGIENKGLSRKNIENKGLIAAKSGQKQPKLAIFSAIFSQKQPNFGQSQPFFAHAFLSTVH
jgi:hypothetical protein